MVLHLTNENATLQKNHLFLTEAYIYIVSVNSRKRALNSLKWVIYLANPD